MPGPVIQTQADREKAVADFMECGGNSHETARRWGVTHNAVCAWRKKSWWLEIEQRYADEIRRDAVIRLRIAIQNAVHELQDRIVNGDTKVMAGGQLVKAPVSARDLAIVLDRLHGNLRLLEGKPQSIRVQTNLKDLASALRSGADLATLTHQDQGISSLEGQGIDSAAEVVQGQG